MRHKSGLRYFAMYKYSSAIFFFVLTLALSLFFFFYNLNGAKLRFGDETLHSSVIKEMQISGNWLKPTFRNHIYLSKPPLKMWFTLSLLKFAEPSNFWLRFPDALFAALSCLIIFLLVLKMFGSSGSAFLAVLLLMGSHTFLFRHCARMAVQDSSLFLCTCLSLFFFWLLYDRKNKFPDKTFVSLSCVIAAATAIGLLTKYIAGLYGVLCGFSFLLFTTPLKKFLQRWTKEILIIMSCAILPFLAWLIFIATNYYQDFHDTFIVEIIQRLFGSGIHQPHNRTIYFDELYGRGALLTPALIWPLTLYWLYKVIKGNHKWIFLFCWGFVPIIIFSLLSSKLIWYSIPSYPAFCIAGAVFLNDLISLRNSGFFKIRPLLKIIYQTLLIVFIAYITWQFSFMLSNNIKELNRKSAYKVQETVTKIRNWAAENPGTEILFATPAAVSILEKTTLPDYDRYYLMDLLPETTFIDSNNLPAVSSADFIIFPACKYKEVTAKYRLTNCEVFDATMTIANHGRFPKNHYIAACLKDNCQIFQNACDRIRPNIKEEDCNKLNEALQRAAKGMTHSDYVKKPSFYAPLRDL